MKKEILGVFLIWAGVFLSCYVGIWLMFVGGTVDVIEQVRAKTLEAMAVAIGVAKVLFAGFIRRLTAVVFCFPGFLLFERS